MSKLKNEAFKNCKVYCTNESIFLGEIEDFDGKFWITSRKFDSPVKTEAARVVLMSQFERGYFDLLEWKMLTQSLFYLLNLDNKEKSLSEF